MSGNNKVQRVVHVLYSGLGGHGAVMFGMLEAGFYADAEHLVLLTGVEEPLQDYVERLDQRQRRNCLVCCRVDPVCSVLHRCVLQRPAQGFMRLSECALPDQCAALNPVSCRTSIK